MAIQNQQELDFEKQLVDHKSHQELQRLNLQAGFTYVAEGTKAAFLLNGAAAIALMTFIGGQRSEWPAIELTSALATFAAGAGSAVLTLGIAYMSQSFFALMNVHRKQRSTAAEIFQIAGIFTFVGSVLLFLLGLARTGAGLSAKFSLWSVLGL